MNLGATVDTPHYTKRLFDIHYTYTNKDGDYESASRVVEHVHYQKWVKDELPKTKDEVLTLLSVAENFAAHHIHE